MKSGRFGWMLVCVLGVSGLMIQFVGACPFCESPSMRLSEQMEAADAVVLVKWTGGVPSKATDAGSTNFEVVDVFHQPKSGTLEKGSKLSVIRYRASKEGDLFLMLGSIISDKVTWGSPLEISMGGYEYLKNAPAPKEPAAKRLPYFLKYLENADRMISDDAFAEFAGASYTDVVHLRKELPREKLRQWLTSTSVSGGRLGFYGMLLGLCGTDEDAKLMEHRIVENTDEFRMGIEGIMGGYLLLTGERGLQVLEDTKLKDKKVPFSETYAVMQAVRFMWQYGNDRIEPERLRQTMRILLSRPELADLVIADLSRMKDWSSMDRLMEIYDDEDQFNIPSIKRAIIRYLLVAAKDTGAKKSDASDTGATSSENVAPAAPPPHVVHAEKCLEELEKRDPKTVREAKRFSVLK